MRHCVCVGVDGRAVGIVMLTTASWLLKKTIYIKQTTVQLTRQQTTNQHQTAMWFLANNSDNNNSDNSDNNNNSNNSDNNHQ